MSAEIDTLNETEPSPEIADAAMRAAFDKALPPGADVEPEDDEDDAPAKAATPAKKITPPAKKPQAADEDDESDDDDEAQASVEDPDPDEESDDESDDDEEETEGEEADGSSTAYENALRLLKIKHFTADDLKSLSKARVIEIAARIRKDEAIVTQKLQAQAAEKKASDKAASRPNAEDRPEPVASKGLRENATRLKQLFSEDEIGAIIEPLEYAYSEAQTAMTAMREEFQAGLTEMREQIEETQSRNAAVVRENLRLRLQRKFPEYAEALEDDRASGRVFKKMAALNASGDYKDNLDSLASDAMSLVFKEQGKKKQSLLAKTSGGHKMNGQRTSAEKPDEGIEASMRAIFNASTDPDLSPGQRRRKLNRLSE